MSAAEVLTLPCSYSKHGSCGGGVALGFGIHRRTHRCLCSCHVAGPRVATLRLHLVSTAEPELTPVA